MATRPSLRTKKPVPKPETPEAPATDPAPDPLDDPKVEEFINGTKESEPKPAEPKEDPAEAARKLQEAARKAEEARLEAEAAQHRAWERMHLPWLQPGVHDALTQTNIALPNRLKIKLNWILSNRHRFPSIDPKVSTARIVSDLLEQWVNERLAEANIDAE